MRPLRRIIDHRFWPLFMKELRQIKRNHKLVAMLIMPPTVNLVLLGFAMNPEVRDLRLGVVDESRTAESRALISAFVEGRSFRVGGQYASAEGLGRALGEGGLDAGLVIPHDFAALRAQGAEVEVQILVDSVNSNTAGIAAGYAARVVAAHGAKGAAAGGAPLSARARDAGGGGGGAAPGVAQRVAVLYNPGLRNSWFIVTGMMGILMVLISSLVAAASMVAEKESGTVEQLLMTPAGSAEIITAKIAPIMLLLSADIFLAIIVGGLVFGIPVRGSLLLLYFGGMLCALSGIGIGTFIATFTRSQTQAQLMSFFVNPPIAMLAGATTPVEAMPGWLQPIVNLNPVYHFSRLSRGVMLKGVGLDVLYPHVLALVAFAVVIVGASVWRFRKQLS